MSFQISLLYSNKNGNAPYFPFFTFFVKHMHLGVRPGAAPRCPATRVKCEAPPPCSTAGGSPPPAPALPPGGPDCFVVLGRRFRPPPPLMILLLRRRRREDPRMTQNPSATTGPRRRVRFPENPPRVPEPPPMRRRMELTVLRSFPRERGKKRSRLSRRPVL